MYDNNRPARFALYSSHWHRRRIGRPTKYARRLTLDGGETATAKHRFKMKKDYCHVFVTFFCTLMTITAAQFNNKCLTPNDEDGVCIGLKMCEKLRTLMETRRHIESVKEHLRKSFCGHEGQSPKVCCPLEGRTTTTTSTTRSVKNFKPKPSKGVAAGSPSRLPSRNACGRVHGIRDRIFGGNPATIGAWPWMVALGYESLDRNNRRRINWGCGGTLISNRHVITAAHCTVDLQTERLTVARLGDLDLDPDVSDGAMPVDVSIERIVTHEGYNNGGKIINDIALLKLKRTVTFNKFIQPICLPISLDMRHASLEKKMPFVVGWGSTHASDLYRKIVPPPVTTMMEVQVPVTNLAQCKQAYAGLKTTLIDDTVICAGYPQGGKDSCQGDSGGPMMIPVGEKFYLMGVVSYGPKKCGAPGYPGVYTRVSSFVDWITEKVNDN